MTVRELCHAMNMECDNSAIADFQVVVVANGIRNITYDTYELDAVQARPSSIGRSAFIITANAS